MTIRNLLKRVILAPFAAVFHRPAAIARVALTFDDGPHPEYTLAASAILKEAGAKGTFFLIGANVVKYPEVVAKLIEDGHEVASHSMTHPEIRDLPADALAAEIEAMYQLRLPDGSPVFRQRFLRPPKGVVTARLVAYCIRHGIRMIFWNIDPEDYKAESSRQILNRLEQTAPGPGDIVLLHDTSRHLVEALPEVIQRVRARGLTPVTVSELLAA